MSRSAASRTGSADPSAMTRLSVGPSTIIVATPWRCISTWAHVTAGEPGPTTLRTRGIDSVPKPERGQPGRTVDPEHVGDAELAAHDEHGRVDRPVAAGDRRDDGDDLRHAGDDRRHAELVGDARVAGLARRDVEAGRRDRRDLLADVQAGLGLERPVAGAGHQLLVERPAVGDGVVERGVDARRHRRRRPARRRSPAAGRARARCRRSGPARRTRRGRRASARPRSARRSTPRSSGSKMSASPRAHSAVRAASSISPHRISRSTVSIAADGTANVPSECLASIGVWDGRNPAAHTPMSTPRTGVSGTIAPCPSPSSSAPSGVTRARPRSSTCWPRSTPTSCATRAATTPGTPSSSAASATPSS